MNAEVDKIIEEFGLDFPSSLTEEIDDWLYHAFKTYGIRIKDKERERIYKEMMKILKDYSVDRPIPPAVMRFELAFI